MIKTYFLVCAPSVESDQLRICAVWCPNCPHGKTWHARQSKMRSAKILIRLCECTGWSESSLGAHVQKYVSDVVVSDVAAHVICAVWNVLLGHHNVLSRQCTFRPWHCSFLTMYFWGTPTYFRIIYFWGMTMYIPDNVLLGQNNVLSG